MKSIEMQKLKICQDARIIMLGVGTKVISGTSVMFHLNSATDLRWIFDSDYDKDCIEGLTMSFWLGSRYVARLNEIKNQEIQKTHEGQTNLQEERIPPLTPFQESFLKFNKEKAILYDPSSEVFYFSATRKNKSGREVLNRSKKALTDFCNEQKAPASVMVLLRSDHTNYYSTFEKIYNNEKQKSGLITWTLVTQQNHGADIAFVPTPYVSGKDTIVFKTALQMNFEAEALSETISVPIGHYYCLDANFFNDGDVVDVAIKMFEEQYLKFDKTYQRVVAIKIVNDRFNDDPDGMENLKNFLSSIRKIRDNTGIVFILFKGMATGYASLAKGFDLYSFPSNGNISAGYNGGGLGSKRAGLYDSKWLMKRRYPSVLRYFRQNGFLPTEGNYGASIAFTDPNTLDITEWNLRAKKVLAEVKSNEAKKIRDGILNGSVRTIRDVFLSSKRKEYIDIL